MTTILITIDENDPAILAAVNKVAQDFDTSDAATLIALREFLQSKVDDLLSDLSEMTGKQTVRFEKYIAAARKKLKESDNE